MLTRPQVQRYATESGLRDLMIAEKEIILTYLLQLFAERQILPKLAFKGGTCLRKMFIGTGGRFSSDLDFTSLEEHDADDCIKGLSLLADLTPDEQILAADPYQREGAIWERLRNDLPVP